jgi:hypothetical protein
VLYSDLCQTAFFCNGPQCKATPNAIGALLRHGYPPETILYYRGGMHDWITLGYPSAPGDGAPGTTACWYQSRFYRGHAQRDCALKRMATGSPRPRFLRQHPTKAVKEVDLS